MGILQHMQNVCLYKNIASLFVVAKGWKQWKCLLIADWLQLSPQYIINKTTKVQNYPTTLEDKRMYPYLLLFWNGTQEASNNGYIHRGK